MGHERRSATVADVADVADSTQMNDVPETIVGCYGRDIASFIEVHGT
jgi:hypothetical protein